jgi:hypothetical protein
MNQNSIFNRVYYVFLFLSLVALVFYLGYLFGLRQVHNEQPSSITAVNPNGNQLNSISDIQQRPIIGSENSVDVQTYGLIYFIITADNRTEIFIELEDVPLTITQQGTTNSVSVPTELSIDIARLDGQTYTYDNISSVDGVINYIALNQPFGGRMSGTYAGFIEEPVFDRETGNQNISRLVFRDLNAARADRNLPTTADPVENLFVDNDTDLPIGIRGNPEAGIPGEPAPFFWVKF